MSDELIWRCNKPNIVMHLRAREADLGKSPAYRRNCRMWRTLICDNTLPVANAGHRPYILGLTKCQHLIRIDLKTGRILQKIFLGQHHLFSKFIYLNWDVFQERAVACSTQSKSSTGPMKSFVLLSVFPLDVIGQLTVTQQVFGADICNANISDGLLIVMHRNNRVRMYNLDQIIKENTRFSLQLGEVAPTVLVGSSSSVTSGVVGSYPTGIPTNIHITERPPILLEVSCLQHDVCFGGYPWHYMYIPQTSDPLLPPNADAGTETYIVASVATNQMVESGLLEMDSDSDDVTMAFFHMDDSQRIIQLGDYDLIVNAFHTRDDGKIELQIVYRVSHPVVDKHLEGEEEKQQKDLANWETTLSGRRVSTKWRKQLRVRNQIRDISFDSELDFLLVSFVTTTGFSPVGTKGELGIYCNQTGRLLKMMDLDIAEFDTPSCPTLIEMDMDFMVHIYEGDHRGKMTCSLYRLDRPME
ncbi:DDB1- and CUL4-associated factor 17-like isoform X2 [Acanthaster planci]|uniref:DDB1- and CUL4-associated factor 17-like isoform X2 n=1 Tax=Acanthaster planci TaxID=133434 RepID=A0A8B7Z7G7_ACAPL|nr:DDB1- and CUL4-associated factor 17-like isoform X2 [Acanthaster planci]